MHFSQIGPSIQPSSLSLQQTEGLYPHILESSFVNRQRQEGATLKKLRPISPLKNFSSKKATIQANITKIQFLYYKFKMLDHEIYIPSLLPQPWKFLDLKQIVLINEKTGVFCVDHSNWWYEIQRPNFPFYLEHSLYHPDYKIELWDIETGKRLGPCLTAKRFSSQKQVFKDPIIAEISHLFCSEPEVLITGLFLNSWKFKKDISQRGSFRLDTWRVTENSWEHLHSLPIGAVVAALVTQRLFITCNEKHLLQIWNPVSGENTFSLSFGAQHPLSDLRFFNETVWTIDQQKKKVEARPLLEGKLKEPTQKMAFESPLTLFLQIQTESTYFLTAHQDKTLQVWDRDCCMIQKRQEEISSPQRLAVFQDRLIQETPQGFSVQKVSSNALDLEILTKKVDHWLMHNQLLLTFTKKALVVDVWDIVSGEKICSIPCSPAEKILDACFLSEGKLLLQADDKVIIQDFGAPLETVLIQLRDQLSDSYYDKQDQQEALQRLQLLTQYPSIKAHLPSQLRKHSYAQWAEAITAYLTKELSVSQRSPSPELAERKE